ncbi:zf-TFIIB domain-containing protein [Delftia sp. PS-11]|uniref:TFIIB-type zinc ribbon-containing protein n=1 Tax=Delftia sp. PS-11 TaxID=2767222 RepID=UPI002453C3AA|nr:zf-TFIIB domain-containing protein [Delftia sp. PS-11]KAJ8744208.1 zf-TFIIB domain-containing protein [Delftia sp. PS-11]
MQCPACRDAMLLITERQNIEIDYCPQCRGVWLDRGELDKLIERSVAAMPQTQARSSPPSRDTRDHREYREHDGHRRKKREGFLSDLFDF